MGLTELKSRLTAALAGRYEKLSHLGEGGMAIVFLATDIRHNRQVAIKVLKPELALALGPERFVREISVAASLNHPNILALYDSGEVDGLLFYVMPYVDGESLRTRLKQETQLPIEEALRITRQVSAALGHAHSHGIVHRDIKPENILLLGQQALVADFGIAMAFGSEAAQQRLTQTGVAVGTPAYMSPEQIGATQALDGRSDLYSLGCVLFEMLIGDPPFGGPTPQVILARHSMEKVPTLTAIRDTIPQTVELAITRALAKVPADRYATMEQFVSALDTETTASLTGRGPDPVKQSVWRPIAITVSVSLVIGAATWFAIRPGGQVLARLDPDLVAVMPFRVRGTLDPTLSGLAEGMTELLHVRLPGDGGLRAVYPATVAAALKGEATHENANLALDVAIRVAQKLGAEKVLLGQIFVAGDKLVLNATVHAVPDGRELARTGDIAGSPDSLFGLVDRLAAELLTRGAGETGRRLSDLTTTDLNALRPYLAGKAAVAGGRYSEALRQFRQALDVDSTFALAALEMASAASFVRGEEDARAQALAWASRRRLGPRDQLYLRAVAGPRYPRASSSREYLVAWEAAVSAQGDRVELWHHLGERVLHSGPWLGLVDIEERATVAFRKVLELDSAFAPALAHLIDLAARRGDTAAVRQLVVRYLEVDSVGDLADFYRWRSAVARGDTALLVALRTRLPELGAAALERIIAVAQLDATGMEDAIAAAKALRLKSSVGRDVTWAQIKLREIALNRGRPQEASEIVTSLRGPTTSAFDAHKDVVEALYWGADRERVDRVVAERASSADAPVPAGALATSPQYRDKCSVSLWRLAHGDVRTVPRAIAELRAVKSPLDDSHTGYIEVCASVLETKLAAVRNDANAAALLDHLDSLARTGPASRSWLVIAANLTVAELREAQGAIAQALAATRRRIYQYDLGEPRVLVALATFLREEGRLAELSGDTAGAVRAYRHYLTLRDAPELSVAEEVRRVRAALARLQHGS